MLKLLQGRDVQIIVATHSPYIFQRNDPAREECLVIDRTRTEAYKAELNVCHPNGSKATSINLASYQALGITSAELHIELYELLQRKFPINNVGRLDDEINKLTSTRCNRHVKNLSSFQNEPKISVNETTPTWIRNCLHHPGNTERRKYSDVDLKSSIDEMVGILNAP